MKKILTLITFNLLAVLSLNAQTFTQFDLYVNTNAQGPSSFPEYFVEYNGKMYFSAYTLATGNEVWVTDGTEAGTYMLKDVRPGSSGSNPESYVVSNGKLFFIATTATAGEEVWVSDGTAAGTQLLKDIRP